MTVAEIANKRNELMEMYKTIEEYLTARDDWKSFKSDDWTLRYVMINKDGSLSANIKWNEEYLDLEQHIEIYPDNYLNSLSSDSKEK